MPVGGTAFYGQNQHPRITTNYLNQKGRHGDPAPGVSVSTAQVSGSIVQPYGGFIGGKLTITNPWAKQYGDPAVGPLYGGVYQYVRVDPNLSAFIAPNVKRGNFAFWVDELNYIVTADINAGPGLKLAGVFLNSTLTGYWDFIQIAGIASCFFQGTVGGIGSMAGVQVGGVPVPVAHVVTTVDQNFLGTVVITDALDGVISPVELNMLVGANF